MRDALTGAEPAATVQLPPHGVAVLTTD
jgi:hypothetical protein